MSYRQPYQDPRSERLLLVCLEDKQYQGSEYRHIRATVIRRAVSHKLTPIIEEGDVQRVEEYFDDHPNKCSGYRVASYVFQGPKIFMLMTCNCVVKSTMCPNPCAVVCHTAMQFRSHLTR